MACTSTFEPHVTSSESSDSLRLAPSFALPYCLVDLHFQHNMILTEHMLYGVAINFEHCGKSNFLRERDKLCAVRGRAIRFVTISRSPDAMAHSLGASPRPTVPMWLARERYDSSRTDWRYHLRIAIS